MALRSTVASVLAASITLFSTQASATDAEPRIPDSTQRAETHRSVGVSLNPLAVGLGRAGGNLEIALAPHHEIVASPFGAMRSTSYEGGDTVATRPSFGGELGYRYLFGRRSFNGLFIGGSALFERVVPDRGEYGTMLLGGAVDLGGQVVTKGGLLIGAGLGFQWTASTVSRVRVSGLPLAVEQGPQPRLLFSVGYAF